MMDMNSFVWVSGKTIGALGGAILSASATLPIANNSLTSDIQGPISGGGGFADSFYQPFILGWRTKRAELRAIYGFLAPTGRFNAGSNNNVGSGYWTSVLSAGQTIYLDGEKATALSAFQMYEFHGAQEGTKIHPGQTLNLDYSLTQSFRLQRRPASSIGTGGLRTVADYGQDWTNDYAQEAGAHYKVNALGFAANAMLPDRKMSIGVKYFHEFPADLPIRDTHCRFLPR